jgi:hypothetical protein
MPEQLSFAISYEYNSQQVGVTVPVRLRTWAEAIDVESGKLEKLSTVTGSFVVYGHEVTLDVLGLEIATTVYFAADENFRRNVLGRQGWLDRVRLGLIDYEGKLFLSDYNDPN